MELLKGPGHELTHIHDGPALAHRAIRFRGEYHKPLRLSLHWALICLFDSHAGNYDARWDASHQRKSMISLSI